MNRCRWLGVAVLVCIPAIARADDKPDYAKLLVGKWEVTKADEGTVPAGTMVEFTKDNKFKVSGKKDDPSFDGTYTVKDDTFTFTIKIGDEEMTQTITITKISEKELTTKNKDGKVVELTKK